MIHASLIACLLVAASCMNIFTVDSTSDVKPIVESQFPQLCRDIDYCFEALLVKINKMPDKSSQTKALIQAREELHMLQDEYTSSEAYHSIDEYLVRLDTILRTVVCSIQHKSCGWEPLSVEHRFAGIASKTQEHLFLLFLTVADHAQQLKDSIENLDYSFMRSLGSTALDFAHKAKLDLIVERSWYYALLGTYLLWIMPDEQAEKLMNVKVIGKTTDKDGKEVDDKEYSGFIANLRNFIGAAIGKVDLKKKKLEMRKEGPVAEVLSWTNGLVDIEKSGTIFGTISVINICAPRIKRDVEEVYAWLKNELAKPAVEEVKCPCHTKILSYQERAQMVASWVRGFGLELTAQEQQIIVASTAHATQSSLQEIFDKSIALAHKQGVALTLQHVETIIDSLHRRITTSAYAGIERNAYAYCVACSVVVMHELLPTYKIAKATLCNRGAIYHYDSLVAPYSYAEFYKAACCAELANIKSAELVRYNPSYDQVTGAKTRAFEHALKLALGGRNTDYVSPEVRYQYYDATWNFVEQMVEETEAIIMRNIEKVHALAQALVNRDTISSDEIYAIIA